MSDEAPPHLGVPDAEIYGGNLDGWIEAISKVIELMNSGDLVFAAAKLGELKRELRDERVSLNDAWDDWGLQQDAQNAAA